MITLRPDRPLFGTRFAYSPLWETLSAVRCILYPDKHTLHARWARRHRALRGSFGILADVLPRSGWSPDFLAPPPGSGPTRSLEAELELVLSTPGETVRQELARVTTTVDGAHRLRAAAEQPARLLEQLADSLRRCHRDVLEPVWPRVRTQLESDIDYRGALLVSGGLPAVLADLRPEVSFDADAIRVRSARTLERALDDRGLLLMPSIFSWPTVTVYAEGSWQPSIVYRARGAGEVWLEAGRPGHALGVLIGRRRAMILELLVRAQSTTSVAQTLGVSPATVSEHLQAMHRAGLVSRRRQGREQLYRQSPLARQLIEACS